MTPTKKYLHINFVLVMHVCLSTLQVVKVAE